MRGVIKWIRLAGVREVARGLESIPQAYPNPVSGGPLPRTLAAVEATLTSSAVCSCACVRWETRQRESAVKASGASF